MALSLQKTEPAEQNPAAAQMLQVSRSYLKLAANKFEKAGSALL
jgi:transposase